MKKKPASKKSAARKVATKKAAPRKAAPRKVNWIPRGYHVVTPYLSIAGASAAIDFYKRAFGAKERMRMESGPGKIGHAELEIGDAVVMLADEHPEMDFLGPKTRGGTSVTLHMYVKDVDAVFAQAIKAGATVSRPVKDEFYGDRTGSLADPFGHVWHVATHKEELTDAEIRKRMEAMMGS